MLGRRLRPRPSLCWVGCRWSSTGLEVEQRSSRWTTSGSSGRCCLPRNNTIAPRCCSIRRLGTQRPLHQSSVSPRSAETVSLRAHGRQHTAMRRARWVFAFRICATGCIVTATAKDGMCVVTEVVGHAVVAVPAALDRRCRVPISAGHVPSDARGVLYLVGDPAIARHRNRLSARVAWARY